MKPFDFWPEGNYLRSPEAEENYSAMLRRLNAKLAVAWWKRKRPA